jgi:L-amino acid N-acyltransferase YncA
MHRIRPAGPQDLGTIADIYADAVENSLATWDHQPPDVAAMGELFAARIGAGYPFLAAEDADGKISGYAYGSPFHPQAGWRYVIEDSIYVAVPCRGRGIGRALLQGLIEAATDLGFRQMVAGVSLPGGEGSLAFHQALGFRKVGKFVDAGWKGGRWLTAVYLQRKLGDGAQTAPEMS